MKRRFYCLAIVVAAAALLTACAGDTSDEGTSAEDEALAQDTPVATQEAGLVGEDELISLLEQSSQAQQAVETFRGRMSADMKMTGMTVSMKADYAFRLPDEMYMRMEADPVSSEMVMTEGRFFMKIAGAEWEEMPSEDALPFDPESMMDVASMAESGLELLENLEIHEGEVIDGVETVHISYEVDMEKAMGQASDLLGESFSDLLGEIGESADLSGKLPTDIWLGEDDKLPRRMEFQMEGKLFGEDYEMKMTMELFDYDEPVDIPSLEEILAEIGA